MPGPFGFPAQPTAASSSSAGTSKQGHSDKGRFGGVITTFTRPFYRVPPSCFST